MDQGSHDGSVFPVAVPARQKLFWVLDILLFLSFGYVLVSGILISKVVFPGLGGGAAFKMGHYAVAALALLLTGVHVGLHMGWVGQRMGFLKRLPLLVRRGLAVLLSIAVLVFGGLQLTSTSFLSWLGNIGAVFGVVQAMPEGGPVQREAAATVAVSSTDGAGTVVLPQTDGAGAAAGSETGSQTAVGNGMEAMRGGHGENGTAASGNVASVLLGFMSLMLSFATLTAWADAALHAVRRRRLRKTAGLRQGTVQSEG